MKTFGEVIQEIRLSKNMSQEEFSKLLHTSKQVISRYETGQRTPKISVAVDYAKILGVPLSYLMGSDDDSIDESLQDYNMVKIIGRDGTYIEKRLTDEQVKALEMMVSQLPEAPEDL